MPSVKLSIVAGLVSAAVGASGCTKLQLARFAPPGIIKYEDIASQKPPHPVIEERISKRKTDAPSEYPIIARTPGESDRPNGRSKDERDAEMTELAAARDSLEAAVAADRDAAEAELSEDPLFSLSQRRDSLVERLDQDAAAAARERKDSIAADEQDRN